MPTPLKLQDKVLLEQTNLVHRMFQGLGEMPLFLVQHAGVRDVLYGYVGTEDYTLAPLIRPGAFVQIDPHQNKVVKNAGPSEYDRPVYFVELRDNRYACSWCDYEGSRLLLVPAPHVAGAHPVASLSSGCRDRRTGYRDCDADCGAAHRCFGHAFSTVRNSRALHQSGG